MAYVPLYEDQGGPAAAAALVRERFGAEIVGSTETALSELAANFADADAKGSQAFASTMSGMHPELDADVLANDAVAAVATFVSGCLSGPRSRSGGQF